MADLADLYQEVLLQHHRSPSHQGRLPGATHRGEASNRSCGDEITVEAKICDHRLESVQFVGNGCAIMRASASLLTDSLRGMTLEQATQRKALIEKLVESDSTPNDGSLQSEPWRALAAVSAFPARWRCALLPWEALGSILNQSGG